MNKQQYLNFMRKYANKGYLKHCKQKKQEHNADGTFASNSFRTINLQRYRQKNDKK